MRDPRSRNLVLEALLEERDHLMIQINLLEHSPKPNAARLDDMRSELKEIESRISRHQPGY